MNKKGFTLIELLAVIIILAIVALIATPMILDVVADAKKSAAESETNMIISGINNYCSASDMKNQMNGAVDICSDGVSAADVATMVNLGKAKILEPAPEYTKGSGLQKIVVESNGYKCTFDNSKPTDKVVCVEKK